jgi:ribosomal protein S21
MVEVRKKPKENTPSLARRFSTKLRRSGVLLEARKRQFSKRSRNKRARKEKALRRIEKISQAE